MIAPFQHIDLLNLDSYDVDFKNPNDSAMHHLKELLAAAPLISKDTLILVDDSPSCAHFCFEAGFIKLASHQKNRWQTQVCGELYEKNWQQSGHSGLPSRLDRHVT